VPEFLLALADEVSHNPMVLPHLKIVWAQPDHFGMAKMHSQQPDATTSLTQNGVVMAAEAITGRLPRRSADGTVIAGALPGQLGVEDGARKSALRQILLSAWPTTPSSGVPP
jgi:hypothetical protein